MSTITFSFCNMCAACPIHCSHCDAVDSGAEKCNDDGCDKGYMIDKSTRKCIPGEF